MKKILASFVIILLFLSFGSVFAIEEKNVLETNTASQIEEQSEELNSVIIKQKRTSIYTIFYTML